MMTTEQALKELHDVYMKKPSLPLRVLIPEVNDAQWLALYQVLTFDLSLTEAQQAILNDLIGRKS